MKNLLVTATFCVLSMLSIAQVPAYVPTSGLVVFYSFNGNANDFSGNNFNGTVTGAALTTDRFGNSNSAYSFVSGNQIVSNPSLPIGNSARSISLWFQTSSTSYNSSTGLGANVMMSYGSGPGTSGSGVSGQLHCETEVGVLVLNHYATGLGGGSNYVSNGQWHNMIYTFDGSVHKLFLDGVLIDTDTYALNTGITSLYFGKRASEPNWHQYNGKVDEAGIWNRALTLCEIQSLYTGILPNTSVNAGADQAICAGTPVTLSANGASTYSWNNGVSNGLAFAPTSTSVYSVTGTDANGCIGTDQVVVTVNALPTVDAGIDQTLCSGATAILNATGATTYSWDNSVNNGVSFTPASTTTYSVSGTDANGCFNTDQVVVTVNALPAVNAGADQSICKGSAVTLTGTGASTYSWDNNIVDGVAFNPNVTSSYAVSGTDANGCVNADEVLVTVNEASGSTLTESALDSYTLNGQTYTQSGTYTQVITNAAGCDSTITLNLTLSFTGLDELSHSIRVYPNPASEELTIESSSALKGEFILFDAAGRNVLEGGLTGTMTRITLDGIASGFYSIQLNNESLPLTIIKQ